MGTVLLFDAYLGYPEWRRGDPAFDGFGKRAAVRLAGS